MSDVALFEEIKPAYSVEDMVSSLSHDNGLTAVSTFSGCGGSSLGLRRAGWRIPYAEEIVSKELSLAGVQRPLDPAVLARYGAVEFLRFGDFAGYLIEAPK